MKNRKIAPKNLKVTHGETNSTEESQISSTRQKVSPDFHIVPNPFKGLSLDQKQFVIEETSKKSEETYQRALSELRKELRNYNPLNVLSTLSFYGLSAFINENTGVTKLDSEYKIFPYHIELLQALILQITVEDLSSKHIPPEKITQIWNQIKKLCLANYYRHLKSIDLNQSVNENTVVYIQQLIRTNTQFVRNWGYHSQVKRISRQLYCQFDAQLLEERGISVSDIFDVFEAIFSEVGDRINEYHNTLIKLIKSSGSNGNLLVKNYCAHIGLERVEAEQFIHDLKVDGMTFENVCAMIMSHHYLGLSGVYTIHATDLAKILDMDKFKVNTILDEYSLSIGALINKNAEHFHLSNPVWEKPIINLGSDKYFCVIPSSFFSFVFPCIEAVLEPCVKDISKHRAKFLESKVAEILESRFPNSLIIRNYKWEEEGKTFETDLIAFINSYVLLIECKSGKVTPPALRGAPERLRKHIKELLIDPNLQSLRLKKHLENLNSNPDKANSICKLNGYDLTKVHNIVRVSVCLEDFGPIQSCLKQLENTDWLPKDFLPCPNMNLASFETVFDILEHPAQILHYLIKREALETSIGYLSDELDLLGLYLKTLLCIDYDGSVENFSFIELSAPLDNYYNSLDAGVTLVKPQPEISPLFSSIFSKLEQRGFTRWMEIGVALYMFSPDDQIRITKKIGILEKRVHKIWRRKGHINTLIFTPQKSSCFALCYVMFKNGNANMRVEFMNHAANHAMKNDHVQNVVVIAKNIDRSSDAYDTIGLCTRSDKI